MRALPLALLFTLTASSVSAADSSFADPSRFVATSGEEVYRGVCQGCHMPEGEGAAGAGVYPPLASNPALESPEYAIYLVIHGQKAMPPFGEMLDDAQIAAVVEYVRTHFGNDYPDPVPSEAVRDAR
jgi:mono/diheme cytochrome c family protein